MTFQIKVGVSYLFLFIVSVSTNEDAHQIQQIKGNILCRNCGSDVSSSGSLFSKSSPKSRYSFNDTLFDIDDVLVQVFATDVFFLYPLISFAYSTCVPTGEWEDSTSWFPGYLWKPCVCPDCGAYIGFIFEPIDPSLVEPSKTFYGLVLTSLISEHYCFWCECLVLSSRCPKRTPQLHNLLIITIHNLLLQMIENLSAHQHKTI